VAEDKTGQAKALSAAAVQAVGGVEVAGEYVVAGVWVGFVLQGVGAE
jgi:hypothetical protein